MNDQKIDFTKPVQTCETPPRPVEIVTTKGREPQRVVGYISAELHIRTWGSDGRYYSNGGGTSVIDLQNVPEPKKWRVWKDASEVPHDALFRRKEGAARFTLWERIQRMDVNGPVLQTGGYLFVALFNDFEHSTTGPNGPWHPCGVEE